MLEEEELEQTQQKLGSQETEAAGIPVEENSSLSNFHKHKLFIGFLKILPMVMAILYLSNTVLSYFI